MRGSDRTSRHSNSLLSLPLGPSSSRIIGKKAENMRSPAHVPNQHGEASIEEKLACRRCRIPIVPHDVAMEVPTLALEEESSTLLGDTLRRMMQSMVVPGLTVVGNNSNSEPESSSSKFCVDIIEKHPYKLFGSVSAFTDPHSECHDATRKSKQPDDPDSLHIKSVSSLKQNKGCPRSQHEIKRKPSNLLKPQINLSFEGIPTQTTTLTCNLTLNQAPNVSDSIAKLTKKSGQLNISDFIDIDRTDRYYRKNASKAPQKYNNSNKKEEIKNSQERNVVLPVTAPKHLPSLASSSAAVANATSLDMLTRLLCDIQETCRNVNDALSNDVASLDPSSFAF